MTDKTLHSLLLGASALSLGLAAPASAQTEPVDEPVLLEETVAPITSDDEIVVTGSRVRRDTFTSISPLQTITTDVSQAAGLFDPSTILQQSPAAAGQQIDATANGLVLDNGPGSQTLNLRGLGASRTLVLVNGRRLAPAGVEGAPANPSINLIPGSLVQRYDLLLDGASSIYGSDAVAGVSNVVLRDDFDGFEVRASGDLPEQGGGEDYQLSGSWGASGDWGFVGVGAEFDRRDAVLLGDRDFLAGCETEYEVTENGDIRTVGVTNRDRYADVGIAYPEQACRNTGLGSRIRRVPTLGFVYYTPGTTNVGIPNFSDTIVNGVPVDGDGDGIADVDLADYTPNGEFNDRTFISEQEKISVMSYGELKLRGEAGITPYYEALYVEADIFADSGSSQLFTVVPADNAFNPCNPGQPNGVDCGLALDSLRTNPNYIETFRRYNFDGANGTRPEGCGGRTREECTPENVLGLVGERGARSIGGGVVVQGDRDLINIDQNSLRLVGGVKGDLPFMDFGTFENWGFDIYGSYSESRGRSEREGIRDDRLHYALGYDPNIRNETNRLVTLDNGPCSPDAGSPVNADIQQGCVPVNLFAPSLYEGVIGNFATQAERDYVFDTREFDTSYAQSVLSGFATGSIFELPAGKVNLVLGAELRTDDLQSTPGEVASRGLFFGFFSDQGGSGQKTTKEVFGELDIPLIADTPFFEELTVNLAGRLTDDEFYGTNETYSIKGGWRPVPSLLLKGTYGTSFRAPNLRENFLLGTTGFNNLVDPCVTPADALGLEGDYNPAGDTRDPITLANCSAQGIDPTNFSPIPDNVQNYSVEVSTGGSLELEPETSKSFTVGAAFRQPFTDWIDVDLNVNYYEIRVEDTVIDPAAAFIVNDCFTFQPDQRSVFCDRITRNPLGADIEPGRITLVDSSFLNQDEEVVRGLDFNANLGKEIGMFGRPINWGLDLRAGRLLERSQLLIDPTNGDELFDEDVGEFAFPKWTGLGRLSAGVDDWRATWTTRYISSVEQDEDGIDDFGSTFGEPAVANTCSGPERGDVLCRDVGFADEYFQHAASIRYAPEDFSITLGVRNIFDKNPPLVDATEVSSVTNVARGAGYNYNGREFFGAFRKRF